MSNHGFLSDYSYSICGKSGFKCNFIFENGHEYYNNSFLKLIDKLTK